MLCFTFQIRFFVLKTLLQSFLAHFINYITGIIVTSLYHQYVLLNYGFITAYYKIKLQLNISNILFLSFVAGDINIYLVFKLTPGHIIYCTLKYFGFAFKHHFH